MTWVYERYKRLKEDQEDLEEDTISGHPSTPSFKILCIIKKELPL